MTLKKKKIVTHRIGVKTDCRVEANCWVEICSSQFILPRV